MNDDTGQKPAPQAPSPEADAILDARDLACPLPVLKARKRLATLPPGARLLIEATDPMAAIDIPNLCREEGHRLLRHETGAGLLRFLIEKSG